MIGTWNIYLLNRKIAVNHDDPLLACKPPAGKHWSSEFTPQWKKLKSSLMSVFLIAGGTLTPPLRTAENPTLFFFWHCVSSVWLRGHAEGGRNRHEALWANHSRPPHQRRQVGKLQGRGCSQQGWENRALLPVLETKSQRKWTHLNVSQHKQWSLPLAWSGLD